MTDRFWRERPSRLFHNIGQPERIETAESFAEITPDFLEVCLAWRDGVHYRTWYREPPPRHRSEFRSGVTRTLDRIHDQRLLIVGSITELTQLKQLLLEPLSLGERCLGVANGSRGEVL